MNTEKNAKHEKNAPNTSKAPDRNPPKDGVEGEGSYTATHNYQRGLEKSVAEGKSEELAEDAKEALDGEEGAELRAAEAKAKKRAKP